MVFFLSALQSLLDDKGLKEVTTAAKKILDAMNKKEFKLATLLWSKAEDIIENVSGYSVMNWDGHINRLRGGKEF